MTKREELELLIMRIAVATPEGYQRFLKIFLEAYDAITLLDTDDIAHSELIQGFMGVFKFSDEPTSSTIILTAKTMTGFYLNDKLKDAGIDLSADEV